MASGTLIQNTSRQVFSAHTTAMPYSGPSTLPSSWAAPMPPSTAARLRADHRSAASASVTGSSAPLAVPWIGAPDDQGQQVIGQRGDDRADANPARLTCSTILRPNRSEARPSSGIAAM